MIRDLGSDYQKRKQAVLGCTACCCCCLHTLVAGGFFVAGLVKAGDTPSDSKISLNGLPRWGLIALPLLVLLTIPLFIKPSRYLDILLWGVLIWGPAIFPAVILVGWIGGRIGIRLERRKTDDISYQARKVLLDEACKVALGYAGIGFAITLVVIGGLFGLKWLT